LFPFVCFCMFLLDNSVNVWKACMEWWCTRLRCRTRSLVVTVISNRGCVTVV